MEKLDGHCGCTVLVPPKPPGLRMIEHGKVKTVDMEYKGESYVRRCEKHGGGLVELKKWKPEEIKDKPALPFGMSSRELDL